MKNSGQMSFLSKIGEKYHELREHPVLHVVLSKYFIVALIFVVWFAFFDTNNIGSIIRTRRQVRAQKQQIEFYQREIASMDNKLEQLQSQKDTLETFAREEYLYSEPGETVYVVE